MHQQQHYDAVSVRLRPEQHTWARDLVRDIDGLSVSDVTRLAFARLMAASADRGVILDALVEQAHLEAKEIPTRVHGGLPRRDWREA